MDEASKNTDCITLDIWSGNLSCHSKLLVGGIRKLSDWASPITPKILTLRIIRDLHSLPMEVAVQLQTIHVEKKSVEVKLVMIYPSNLHEGGLKIDFVNVNLICWNILKVLHFDFWYAQHDKNRHFFQVFVSILTNFFPGSTCIKVLCEA